MHSLGCSTILHARLNAHLGRIFSKSIRALKAAFTFQFLNICAALLVPFLPAYETEATLYF
jgi:hypothetical protein